MSDDKPKKPNAAEQFEQMQAERRAKRARIQKAAEALGTVFSKVQERLSASVSSYLTDPEFREDMDAFAAEKGKSAYNAMIEVTVQKLKGEEPYTNDMVARAALVALTSSKAIPAAQLANPDIAAVVEVMEAAGAEHTHEKMVDMIRKIGEQLKAPAKPARPGGPPAPKSAPKSAPVSGPSVSPVTVGNWGTDDDAPVAAAPSSSLIPPISLAPDDGGIPGLNFLLNTAEEKTSVAVEAEVKAFIHDVRKIKAVVAEAMKADNISQYQYLGDEGNQKYFRHVFAVANAIEGTLKDNVAKTSGGNKVVVTDANKADWQQLLKDEGARLDGAVTKFEAAEFAISKSKDRRARSNLAASVRKTMTEECVVPVVDKGGKLDLNALDDAVKPPTLMQRHGKTLVASAAGVAILTMAGLGLMVGGRGKPAAPDNEPRQVAKADPVPAPPAEQPKKEVPQAVAPQEQPKKEEPKKEEPREMLPPPREVAKDDMPKEPAGPKELPKAGDKDSPLGLKEAELRALFERKYANIVVFASPRLVERGYFVKQRDSDNYRVADNFKVSYLPGDDVSKGVYVLSNGNTTLVLPPGNTEMELGLVQNTGRARGVSETFHVSILENGKERPLKNQLNEEISFAMPQHLKGQSKFMTGKSLVANRWSSLDMACYWQDKKDIPTGRPVGTKLARTQLLMGMSGRSIGLHGGAFLDISGLMLNPLPQENSRYISGMGDSHDMHIVAYQAVAEPKIRYPRSVFTGYDVACGQVGLSDNKAFLTLQNPYLHGLAAHVPIAGIYPPNDARAALGKNSGAPGQAIVYTHFNAEDNQNSRLTVEYGDSAMPNTQFLRSGQGINNTQDGRTKQFIADIKETMYENERVYTLRELGNAHLLGVRVQAAAARTANEMPNAHGADLVQGAFNEPGKPSLRTGAQAYRLSTGIGGLFKPDEPNGDTTHAVLVSEVQALLSRINERAKQTQTAARTALNEAKDLNTQAARNPDAADKAAQLTQAREKEREAARLLDVAYPKDVNPDGKAPDDLVKAQRAFDAARTKAVRQMQELAGKRTPLDMLKAYLNDVYLPRERRVNDPSVERADLEEGAMLQPRRGGAMLAQAKDTLDGIRKVIDDRQLGLDEFDKQHLLRMFSNGSSDIETAMKGDSRSAAAMLLTKLTMSGKKDLAEAMKPLRGPFDSDNPMQQLVEAFREGVAAGQIDEKKGLSQADMLAMRPASGPSLPSFS